MSAGVIGYLHFLCALLELLFLLETQPLGLLRHRLVPQHEKNPRRSSLTLATPDLVASTAKQYGTFGRGKSHW